MKKFYIEVYYFEKEIGFRKVVSRSTYQLNYSSENIEYFEEDMLEFFNKEQIVDIIEKLNSLEFNATLKVHF